MENKESYLTFRIRSEYYAANVAFVHNIIEYDDVTTVPDMPEYMLGVINLRGRVLPVVDSRIKFGLGKTERSVNTCILVLEVNIEEEQVFVGALVDAVAEVIEISESDIKEPPSIGTRVKNDFITGAYYDSEKFIMLLDLDKVFSHADVIDIQVTH